MTTLTGGVGENVTTGGTGTGFNIGVDLAGILNALTGNGATSLIPGGVSENELIQNYGGGSEVTNYYTPIQDNRSVAVAKAASVAPGMNVSPINPAQSVPLTGGVDDSGFQPSSVSLGPALNINVPNLGTGQNAPRDGMVRIGQQDYPKGAVTADASGAIPPEARNYSNLEREIEAARQQAEVRNAQAARQMDRELQQAQRPPLQAQTPMMAPQPQQMPPNIPMPDTSNPNAPMMPPAQPANPYEQFQKMMPQHVGGGYSANPEQSDRLNIYRNAHAAALQQNLDVLKPRPFPQPVDPRSYDWKMRARAALDPRVAKALDAHMQKQWDIWDKQVQRRQQEVRQARANIASLTNTGLTQEAQIAKTEYSKAFDMAKSMMEKGVPTAANYNLMGRWVTEAYPPGLERDKAIMGIYQGSVGMMNLMPWRDLPQPEIKSVGVAQAVENLVGKQNKNRFEKETFDDRKHILANSAKSSDVNLEVQQRTKEARIELKNLKLETDQQKKELLDKYGEQTFQVKFDEYRQRTRDRALAIVDRRMSDANRHINTFTKAAQTLQFANLMELTDAQKEALKPEQKALLLHYESLLPGLSQAYETIKEGRKLKDHYAGSDSVAEAIKPIPQPSKVRRRISRPQDDIQFAVPPEPVPVTSGNSGGFQRGALLRKAAAQNGGTTVVRRVQSPAGRSANTETGLASPPGIFESLYSSPTKSRKVKRRQATG